MEEPHGVQTPHRIHSIRTLQYDRSTADVQRSVLSFDSTAGSEEELILVSHRWGDVQPLKLFGQTVHVDNPAKIATITALCKAWPDAHVWVDFVCIQQEDDDDKIAHIQLLPELYQRAKLTATVLAHDEFAVVESAIDALRNLAVAIDNGKELDEEFDQLVLNARIRLSACSELEYWKRTWTLQERVLSQNMFFLPYGASTVNIEKAVADMPVIYGLLNNLPKLANANPPMGDLLASLKRAIMPGRFSLTTFETARACFVHALQRSVVQDFAYGRLALLKINLDVGKIWGAKDLDRLLRECLRGLVEKGYLPPGVVLPAACPNGITHKDWSKWEIDACVCHFDQRLSSYFQALRYDAGHDTGIELDMKSHQPQLCALTRADEVVSVKPLDAWSKLLPSEEEVIRNGSGKAIEALRRFEALRSTLASRVASETFPSTNAERIALERALDVLQMGVHPLQWNQITPIVVKTKSDYFFGYMQHTIPIPFDDGRHYFDLRPEFTKQVLDSAHSRVLGLVGTFAIKNAHVVYFVQPPQDLVLTAHVITSSLEFA